jgi:hypothetical protein
MHVDCRAESSWPSNFEIDVTAFDQPPSTTRRFLQSSEWIDQAVSALRFLPRAASIAFAPWPLLISLTCSLLLLPTTWLTPVLERSDLPAEISSEMVYLPGDPPLGKPTLGDFEISHVPTPSLLTWIQASPIPATPLRLPKTWSLSAWTAILLTWVISSLTALSLTRYTARAIAQRDIGIRQLFLEAGRGWFTLLAALALLLAGYVAMQLVLALLMLLVNIPVLGTTLAVLETPLTITFSLLAGIAMLLIVWGWPVLAAAWAIDDCDGFGTISRTVGYGTVGFFTALTTGVVAYAIAMVLTLFLQLLLSAAFSAGVEWSPTLLEDVPGSTWVGTLQMGLGVVGQAVQISIAWTLITAWVLQIRQTVDALPPDAPEIFDRGSLPRETYPVVGLAAVAPHAAPGDSPLDQGSAT